MSAGYGEQEADQLLGSGSTSSLVLSAVSKRLRRTQALVCVLVIALVVVSVPHFDSRVARLDLLSLDVDRSSGRPPRSATDALQFREPQNTLRANLRPDLRYITTLKNGARTLCSAQLTWQAAV